MHKELIISTTPQETKLAILEDEDLVEFYIERHRSQGIVGNIYKGKVTKVLPGMQSAFVDIGLDRDAFLYVSDFFEDTEEYDKIVSTVEDEVASLQEGPRPQIAAPPPIDRIERAKRPEGVDKVERFDKVETVEKARKPEKLDRPERPVTLEPPKAEPIAIIPISALEGETVRPIASSARPVEDREGFDNRGPRRPNRERDRDRDRRGKKPKIPSFENKTYESRQEERPVTGLAVLPGESLSKYVPRPGAERKPAPSRIEGAEEKQERAVEAAAEQPAATIDAGHAHAVPSERNEGSTASTTAVKASETGVRPEASGGEPESDGNLSSNARISERSDRYQFANRPARGRQSRRSSPPPQKAEEPRGNGHSLKAVPMISELLREGQEILVQVSKEPLGKKGARITSHIALPGRYLVYMPTVDHVGVSRKISSDEERSRLRKIIQENKDGLPGGFIVRTAADGRAEDEFVQDIGFLGNLWADIKSKTEKKSAPAMIHRDLNLVQRMLRDQLSADHRAIRLDNEQEFARVLDFVNKFQPALVNRIKLHLKDTPIFEEYGLNVEIDKALKPKVWLKSGGYIVINQTEALVAIDVNTGKFVGKSNRLEDTIVKTNIDAVREIVRQIRLRNLGGIIVIDFIDMEEKKNRQRVMAALEEALAADRSPSKILQFNDFGLVAITRKRTQPSLERILCMPCSHCGGAGWSKSAETICYDVQQEIKKMAHLLEGKEITVRVNPEVAKVLKSGEYISLHELEDWTKRDIIVKSDPLLHEEHFDIF